MSDEFVRKDVHDAEIASLHERIDSANSRIDDIHRRIDDLKAEIRDARDSIIRGWTIIGVLITLGAFVFTAVQFYMSVRGGR